MSRSRSHEGLRVLAVTNVGRSAVQAYLAPLAALDEVAEVVVVRDRPNISVQGKLRLLTPPAWWAGHTVTKLAARSWLLRSEAAERPPDVLTTVHWFPDGPDVLRLARRLGVPLVANIIGSSAELIHGGRKLALSIAPRALKNVAECYFSECLNASTAVTFTGRATLDWFRGFGVRRPQLSVLHAAMDSERLKPGKAGRDIDVVYVGRLDADKRADRALRVLSLLARRHSGLHAALIGIGHDELERLPVFIELRGALGGRLEVRGWISDVAEVLRAAKVLLVTSDSEGRTLAVLEAMLCGAVPVATLVGDLGEAIAEGAGALVPLGGDEDDLVRRLADETDVLLQDEGRRSRMAAQGREQVCREHDPTRTQQEWRGLLRTVVGL